MSVFDPGMYSRQQYLSYEFYDECGVGRSQKKRNRIGENAFTIRESV